MADNSRTHLTALFPTLAFFLVVFVAVGCDVWLVVELAATLSTLLCFCFFERRRHGIELVAVFAAAEVLLSWLRLRLWLRLWWWCVVVVLCLQCCCVCCSCVGLVVVFPASCGGGVIAFAAALGWLLSLLQQQQGRTALHDKKGAK